ncbi:MAG TPA: hypothetical protein VF158_14900 [Longimicrobiales bacterium]
MSSARDFANTAGADAVFRALCRDAGVPEPVTEHRFHPRRHWRFDYAWPDEHVALEVEGGAWTQGRHTRGKGFTADIEKYNEAAASGWTVLRCTPEQLCSPRTVEWIRRAVEARAA